MKFTFGQLSKKEAKEFCQVEFSSEKESFLKVANQGVKILVVGMGERKEMNRRKLFLLARRIIQFAKQHKIKKLAINFSDFRFAQLEIPDSELAQILAHNFEMANFEFTRFKTLLPEGWSFVEEAMVSGRVSQDAKDGFWRGRIIGQQVNASRELANTPGGEMTPRLLADAAKDAVKGTPIKLRVLGPREMEKLKMGGIVGVAKGSDEEPRFIILEYLKGGKERPIVLVGKGVTFDTGGMNLKPTEGIYEMHMDMSGGAAVIHAIVLAAKLKLKKNIVGLIPAVENMLSGSSYRPGDVLRSMSGKTIEVLNTDAEGRIILADALTYAKRYKPRLVVDAATLTGAAMVALGQRAIALFTPDNNLEERLRELGEKSGDYVWPLPLWEEYEEEVKGTFGDVANISKTKYGGAIAGAVFLWQFAKDLALTGSLAKSARSNPSSQVPWVHLDIAPRMTTIEGDFLAKGSAGAPVRLLLKILEHF